MDVTVIVAASTTSTVDPSAYPTIGDVADAAAREHDVAGTSFTLKVDGATFTRDTPAATITDGNVVELIEYADGAYQPVEQPTPDASLVDSSVPPPEQTPDAEE